MTIHHPEIPGRKTQDNPQSPRTQAPLGGVHIFVDQAVEDGFSADLPCVDVGYGRGMSVAFVVGDALGDALVRPGRVVVHLVFGQDGPQMRLAEDKHAVEDLAAQGADEALAGRVHPRRLDGGAQDGGAGRGLGRRIATVFAEAGAPVVAVSRTAAVFAEPASGADTIHPELADAGDATVAASLLGTDRRAKQARSCSSI